MLLCICQYMIVTVKRAFTLAGKHSLKGRNYASSIKKGVMDMLVLALLTQNDRYGYEIVSTFPNILKYLKERYIHCLKTEKEKYVETYLKESSTGPSRKYYHITNEGRTAYNKMRQEWDEFSGVINMLLKGVDYNEQNSFLDALRNIFKKRVLQMWRVL